MIAEYFVVAAVFSLRSWAGASILRVLPDMPCQLSRACRGYRHSQPAKWDERRQQWTCAQPFPTHHVQLRYDPCAFWVVCIKGQLTSIWLISSKFHPRIMFVDLLAFYCHFLHYIAFPCNLLDFIRFYWILLDFIRFSYIFLHFLTFSYIYLTLLGFLTFSYIIIFCNIL